MHLYDINVFFDGQKYVQKIISNPNRSPQSINVIMMLFVRIHKLEDGYKILLSLEQNHFSSNKYIYTTLLNGCFNENNIQLAKKIVDVYSRFYH